MFSEVMAAISEVSMERCLLDMPYVILFDIFRRLSKGKLIEISKLCSKFTDIAGDTRLWKHLHIYYKRNEKPPHGIAFEELYSEPWPVRAIDLSCTQIRPPVSSKTDRTVKVTTLDLSFITANKVTMEAILAKYQCTELYLNGNCLDLQSHNIMGIAPEAFSKQTTLEVLSLVNIKRRYEDFERGITVRLPCELWLAPVLRNCKNLKTLDLNYIHLTNLDMLGFVENLPASLEKLKLLHANPEDSFFESLAKSTPNLRELELCPTSLKCPSLLELKFLEVLHLPFPNQATSALYVYVKKFPALKTVQIICTKTFEDLVKIRFEKLRKTLEPLDVIVGPMEFAYEMPESYNLWVVSNKAV